MHKSAQDMADNMDVIRNVEQEMNNLVAAGLQKPANWETMSYQDKIAQIDNMEKAVGNVGNVATKVTDMLEQERGTIKDLSDMGVQTENATNVAKTRFNLNKYSQEMEQPEPEQQEQEQQASSTDVRDILDGFVQKGIESGLDSKKATAQAFDMALDYITKKKDTNPYDSTVDPLSGAEGNSEQLVRDALKTYYSTIDESEKDQAASILARVFFSTNDENDVPAIERAVKVKLSKLVNETNRIIKAIAENDAKKAFKTIFNLKKQAQHQSIKNVIYFDQDQNTRDQFTGQMISDWHLLERNKGFGLRLTDYYTADWEKAWRENVMDKYDPLYIERRFEVDKNIPVGNSYQLEPGETRRPYLPEYGLTEARLEAERDDRNKLRKEETGTESGREGKIFNWQKEAKKKEAQLTPIQAPMGPLDAKPLGVEAKCTVCGCALKNEGAGQNPKCPQCGHVNTAPTPQIKTAPDPIKMTQTQKIDIEKLAVDHSGIFFHNGKFLVVAGNTKQQFDTYHEAKKALKKPDDYIEPKQFKQLPAQPPATQKRKRLTPEQIARRDEVSQHADMLGIDG